MAAGIIARQTSSCSKLPRTFCRDTEDQGFEDMGDEEALRVNFVPDSSRKKNVDSEFERRKSFVLNMLQGKSGTSSVIDFNYDTEVMPDLFCQALLDLSVFVK